MAVSPFVATRLRHRVAGIVGLTVAVLVLRLPFRWTTALAGMLAHGGRPATYEQATHYVEAARRAARWYPGQAACLETSLNAVIAARLCGKRLDWCIGARQLPYAAHAWVEAAGEPIGEPPDRPYLLLVRM
jgi:hypothetical protein